MAAAPQPRAEGGRWNASAREFRLESLHRVVAFGLICELAPEYDPATIRTALRAAVSQAASLLDQK